MEFHPHKCTTLRCTHSPTPREYDYVLHGHTLSTVSSTKYLGVTLHSKLDWDEHVNAICSKANSTLGFLRRNLRISSARMKEKAYKSFVRPLLEYASSVWDPYEAKLIHQIEKVQRRAARFILNRYHNTSSVTDMVESLKWTSLERRRKNSRLAVFYKMTNNIICCEDLTSQLMPNTRSRRTGSTKQYRRLSPRTNYWGESFLPRTIRDWNDLPQTAVDAATLDTFVSRVSQHH